MIFRSDGSAQVPTTLISLLIFIVLLLPGFAYLVGKERNGTGQHASPFRETVAVVAASVTSEITVLIVFAIIRRIWPSHTPDVGALIRNPGAYLRGTSTAPGHYAQVTIWAAGLLALATAGAYWAANAKVRRAIEWLPFTGDYPHPSTVSAWWLLLEDWPRHKADVQVTCTLDDGSAVQGVVRAFNHSADDSPDRELILGKPIRIRLPSAAEMIDYNAGYACVSAARIVIMFASHVQPVSPAISRWRRFSGLCRRGWHILLALRRRVVLHRGVKGERVTPS
jgi:hypothetical protein